MTAQLAVHPLSRSSPVGSSPTAWGAGAVVGPRSIHVAALDEQGHVVWDERSPVPADPLGPDSVWGSLADALRRLAATAAGSSSTVVGLTLVLPGLLDTRRGLLHDPGGRQPPVLVQEQLSRQVSLPQLRIRLLGQGLLTASAEAALTQDRAAGVLCYLAADGDVVFGAVAEGQALSGAAGLAGQVGHLPLDPLGHECTCGRRGCWATVISLPALLRRATDSDDPVRDPALDAEAQTREIERRALLDDDRTRSALAETGQALGLGAAVLGQVLGPDVVVLGGYLGRLLPYLLPGCEAACRGHGIRHARHPVRFEASAVDDRALVRRAAHRSLSSTDHRDPEAAGSIADER